MKFRKDTDILRFIGMSLGMIFLGAIISFFIQPIFGAGLILVGCLFLLSGAYILGGTNSFLLAARDSPWTPIIVAHIGIYSWGILTYYFVKKGDV